MSKRASRAPFVARFQVRLLWWSIAAILAAGAALRLVGMPKDLWLDEIWSVGIANQMHSLADVFTLHHEINHHLNTLWLYALGPNASPVMYHLLPYAAGVASVFVAGMIGRRRGTTAAIVTMIIIAASYELVLYSSEARGYSTLVLACLAGYYFLTAVVENGRWASLAGYWLCAILGLLSQPIFAGFLAGAVAWTALRCARATPNAYSTVLATIRSQAVPLVAFGLLYLVDLRFVAPGGGTPSGSLVSSFATSLAWALGNPIPGLMWATAILALACLGFAVAQHEFDDRIFFLAATIVFPLLLILIRGSNLVYTRHFLVSTTFLLIAIADLIATWWDSGGRLRWLATAALLFYCASNASHVAQLAKYGRGQYRVAIHYVVDHTPGPFVTVGGDHDFRIGAEVAYYLPSSLGSKQGGFVEHSAWPPEGPQWFIIQRESFEPANPPAAHIADRAKNQYDLVGTYASAPLSGLHWFLYRNRNIHPREG